MRFSHHIPRLLAFAIPAIALAHQHPRRQDQPGVVVYTTIETVIIPDPSPIPAPTYPPDPSPSSSSAPASGTTNSPPTTGGNGQWCVDFTSSDPSFMWAYDGAWGSVADSHTFGSQNPSSCFSGSGAMYVGTSGLSGGTKFECTFASDQANCDVSIVDGYSLAMSCSVPAENYHSGPNPIGGSTDLFTKGSCPSAVVNGICPNPNGHDNVQPPGSSVNAFFVSQAFWYNDWVSEQVQYTGYPHMSCSVSAGGGPSTKLRRDANDTGGIEAGELRVRETMDLEALEVRSRTRQRRRDAWGLRKLVRGPKA